MKRHQLLRPALPLILLSVAACTDPGTQAPEPSPDETMMPVEPDGGIGDGATPPAEMVDGEIPANLHGRWGLVPADCTSDRGDAKGLITIDAEGIEFYESRGVIDTVESNEPGQFRASYDFTGEGMEWVRDMELSLSDDGTQLVRSEFGEDAMAEPLTYTKCPA